MTYPNIGTYARVRGDEGCVVYFKGKTYYGRTGEETWKDSDGRQVDFSYDEFHAMIASGAYEARDALKYETQSWDSIWS